MNRIFSLAVVFILSQIELLNAKPSEPLGGEVGEYYEYPFYDADQSKEEVNKTDIHTGSTRTYLRNNVANERNGKNKVIFDHMVSDSYAKNDAFINDDCDECTNESQCKTCGEATIDSTDQEITNSEQDETTENENENHIILAVDQNDDIQTVKKYFIDMIRNIARKPNDIIASDERYSKALRSDTKISRIDREKVKKTIREEQMKLLKAKKQEEEQAIRHKVIMDFLTTHMMSAKYIWHELKRIEKYHVIRDELRKMVYLMETPYYQKLQIGKDVLDCYEKHFRVIKDTMNVWRYPTNKLVQNFLMDPYHAELLQ